MNLCVIFMFYYLFVTSNTMWLLFVYYNNIHLDTITYFFLIIYIKNKTKYNYRNKTAALSSTLIHIFFLQMLK